MDANSPLLAGYGECLISPPLGLELSGYGFDLERRATAVLDDLQARALYLRREGHALVLISCDLLGFTVQQTDEMRQALRHRFGLAAGSVLLACTHTHTGPATTTLRGCGEPDPSYVAGLGPLIEKAVAIAEADCQPARLSYAMPTIEPLGYNRRKRCFEPIDPVLKTAFLLRASRPIAVTGYACHAVTLGPVASISADWPGAVVRAFEKRGYQAIVFQGFCGDIDPVTNLDRWGQGSREDLDLYGELVCQRALKSLEYATAEESPGLCSTETRIDLPLDVPADPQELEAIRRAWGRELSGAHRVVDDWFGEARRRYPALRAEPFVRAVPIQAMGIGGLRLIGLPGEVFSEYSLRLRAKWPALFTIGYAGGNVGYMPTCEAYSSVDDYACYCAPRCYDVFPYAPEIEQVVLSACKRVLLHVDETVSQGASTEQRDRS